MSDAFARLARRARLKEQTGAVAVIVALFLVVLLVLGALVLDLGSLYDHDRELQAAADAAALAGVQELIYSKGDFAATEAKTREYVSLNALESSVEEANLAPWAPEIVYSSEEKSVTVDLEENGVPFSFARIIGRTEGTVRAHAKAELRYLVSMKTVFPVALPYLHPDHFEVTYGSGAGAISYLLENPLKDDSDTDQGIYQGSVAGRPLNLGPGLHNVTLVAKNEEDEDLVTWNNVGSLFVPSAASLIRRVDVDRNITVPTDVNAQLTEQVDIRVQTSGIPDPPADGLKVQIDVVGQHTGKNPRTLTTSDTGVDRTYTGSISLSTSDFGDDGTATVRIYVVGKKNTTFPDDVPLAYYTWFQRGQSTVYFDQGPDPWDNYSASGSTADLSAEVMLKVYRMGDPVLIKTSDKALTAFFGTDGWADIIVGANTAQEIALALGLPVTLNSYPVVLQCDTAKYGGNGDGAANIGEWIPVETGVRRGQWAELLRTQAIGKVVDIALVNPDPDAFKMAAMQINAFAAILIKDVSIQGNNVSIYGQWTEGLNTGDWVVDKPDTLYVETAVLTE